MRDIKFRVFDRPTGRMFAVNGLRNIGGARPSVRIMGRTSPGAGSLSSVGKGFQPSIDTLYSGRYDLMQYTGVKDMNGVEIYEGDILRYVTPPEHGDQDDYAELYEVEWKSPGFEARWANPRNPKATADGRLSLMLADEDMEVIGNIYQHPELLQVAA